MSALQLVVCRLSIGLGAFVFGVCTFEIRLGTLEIGLRAFALGVRTFEIRLHASALGGERVFQFTPRLRCCVRGRLLGLAPRASDGLAEGAFDIRSRSGDFGLEPRPPLRVNRIQFRRPALFSVDLGALPRFMQRLLVALRQTAEVGIELGLKFGPNGVNDAANLFLGH